MTLPRGFRYLGVFISEYVDIPALFPVIKMFSAKHQHLILNHFTLTTLVLQAFACPSKSFIYEETLPSPFLPAKGRGHLLFIAMLSLCQSIFFCLNSKQLIDLQRSKSHGWRNKFIMGSTWLCQVSLTDLGSQRKQLAVPLCALISFGSCCAHCYTGAPYKVHRHF